MISRRDFLKDSSAATVGGLIATSALGHAAENSTANNNRILKVGLIGCGGRGTGAASQALKADPNVRLTAMADVFADRLQSSLATLKKIRRRQNRRHRSHVVRRPRCLSKGHR